MVKYVLRCLRIAGLQCERTRSQGSDQEQPVKLKLEQKLARSRGLFYSGSALHTSVERIGLYSNRKIFLKLGAKNAELREL